MRKICFTVALALMACLGYAQDEKGALTSFYEKNTVLNFNDGANIAGDPISTSTSASDSRIWKGMPASSHKIARTSTPASK